MLNFGTRITPQFTILFAAAIAKNNVALVKEVSNLLICNLHA